MTEKFTKEPWELSDMSCHDAMDNYTVCFHIGVSSTGEMIADCQSDNKADYERVRANAYLIKAAPEMLEMLDEVGSDLAMAFASVPGIESEIWQEILKEDVEKICAILKKVRGEA